jgi:uncharacterized protein (DUF2062 family)
MLKKRFKKILPTYESVVENKFLRLFGDLLLHPGIWAWNRRSVAGGIATGLFCGLIPGPLQVITATAAAIFFRINLPVAIVGTFYTNPLTIVPLYLLGYEIGAFTLGATGGVAPPPPPDFVWGEFGQSMRELIAWGVNLGAPLALGVLLLAVLLAIGGYIVVRVAWHIYLRHVSVKRKRSGLTSG